MATTKSNRMITSYEEHFDPEEYLAAYRLSKTIHPKLASFFECFAKLYHDIFSCHGSGDRLIDVGSGPTLWHVMSASAKYSSITLSDPLPANRSVQRHFIQDASHDHRWLEHFKLTARLAGDEVAWPGVAARLRAAVTDVLWCDVMEEHPLGEAARGGEYDCVLCSLVLNAACWDVESFGKAVRNLASLAKPGAPVIIGGVLRETFYEFGGQRFPVLRHTPALVEESLEAAGCTVRKFYEHRLHGLADVTSDGDAIFVVEACKL